MGKIHLCPRVESPLLEQTSRKDEEHEAILRMMVYVRGELYQSGLREEARIISEAISSIEEKLDAKTVSVRA